MTDLSVVLVQCDLTWEDRAANLDHIGSLLTSVPSTTQLIVLPEMFTTGFSMEPERTAEHFDVATMETLNTMRIWSQQTNAVIAGSVSIEESGKYYNRLFWVRPDGTFSQYDKRHLFSMGNEDKKYSPGNKIIIEQIDGWNICPLICYDLRFPVWSRNRLREGKPMYDILLYVANWPEIRREPWKKLLIGRAVENQSYVLGVNRVGTDGHGVHHSGDSAIIDPLGNYLQGPKENLEELIHFQIDRNFLSELRKKFPVLHDADDFVISSQLPRFPSHPA